MKLWDLSGFYERTISKRPIAKNKHSRANYLWDNSPVTGGDRIRVHTDRFPKQPLKGRTLLRGVLGHAPPGNLMDFLKLPKVPFPGFLSHSDRMLASSILLGWSLATWKVLSLLKIYLLWKVWPIFVNRWKPVWIRAWVML